MNSTEVQQEKERLISIIDLVKNQIEFFTNDIVESNNHINDINADMRDNAHHLILDFDDVVELQQRSMELTIHMNWLRRDKLKLNMLQKMLVSPYFGRIDFVDPKHKKPMQIYIGINSLAAQSEITPVVYDWRAPICSMFYDFGVGEASYISPSGEIRGYIGLKRQYKIKNGEFEYLLDSDMKIDDEILQKELSMNSESRLRTIISSIQKEQNSAIRYNTEDNLIVFGAAGSGKTSIGLHRLAYQLYRSRGQISSENILIFSQNNVFSSYISDIIPELGEEDITRINFFQLIQKHFGEDWRLSDAYEQMEYFVSASDDDSRIIGIRIKYSQEFLDFLAQYISGLQPAFHDIAIFDDIVCTGEFLAGRYHAEKHEYRPFTKLTRLGDFLEDRIEDYFVRNANEIKLRLVDEMIDAKEIDAEFARRMQGEKDKARQDIASQANFVSTVLYRSVLSGFVKFQGLDEKLYSDVDSQLEAGRLLFEDSLVLLYIRFLTGEIQADQAIRHVLIDEAQDFNLLQHYIIKCLTTGSKYTVLADVEQAMFTTVSIQDQSVLQSIYTGKAIELTKSYRSTRQINELASKLLDGREKDYFDRAGSMPAVLRSCDIASAIRQLLNRKECRECNSIGIITKTAKEAEALHRSIGNATIGLIVKSSEGFKPGVLILPVTLAKGLEFDCVILPDCSEERFHTPCDKRMLYLMCTRALHHLFLVCAGELTSFLAPYENCYEVLNNL